MLADSLVKPHQACAICHSQKMAKSAVHIGWGDQVKDFFLKLFNTADWPPRWHCGTWTDFHGWLYIISDVSIWAAYFAIPFLLFRIVVKRKDIPFPRIFWLFIAFILLCGLTHLLDAIIFWWPAYRLSALLRLLTGVVSIITVYALYRILPLIHNLRTVAQLEAEIAERQKAEEVASHAYVQQLAAEELMRKKDEFMSIASHELKTPITSAKASLQVVERMVIKNEALLPAAPFVEKASKQVNKLTGIINDLLDVTRIQAGKLELVKTDFNLMELIKECIENCQGHDKKHNVAIKGDPDLMINADRNRIDQVLCNLLTNAFKYSPDSKAVSIRFELTPGGQVKVLVTDYGIGIPKDNIDNIFDRFFRVEHTSQNFSGLGLGLYISSEIVKQHNGQIGVYSTLGEGSTFWFSI